MSGFKRCDKHPFMVLSGVPASHCEVCAETSKLTREVEELRAVADQQEKAADLHAKINRGVAKALGQSFGASWHDLPQKVADLRSQVQRLEKRIGTCHRLIGERNITLTAARELAEWVGITLNNAKRNTWPIGLDELKHALAAFRAADGEG